VTLEEIERDWTRLGAQDPLWAVLVAPEKKGGRWDLDEFLATGRKEVEAALATAAALGIKVPPGPALDFGCGVGRISQALAAHCEYVVAVDISSTMLQEAARIDRSGGKVRFLLNGRSDLAPIDTGSMALAYSTLVLQHIPQPAGEAYLPELVRVLKPGGVLIVDLPTRYRFTPAAVAYRMLPAKAVGWLQRAVLRYPAPMRMSVYPSVRVHRVLSASGADIRGELAAVASSPHWVLTRFYAVRR
jgi:ubiquinone/menaquinone biosynthesis C-methylase UbiE